MALLWPQGTLWWEMLDQLRHVANDGPVISHFYHPDMTTLMDHDMHDS